MTDYSVLAAEIQAKEFDSVFIIRGDHAITPRGPIFAPSVYADEDGDHVDSDDWKFVSEGLTGQDRYNGPVLHASEQVSWGVAQRLDEISSDYLAFALVVVEWQSDDEDDLESEPAGWAIVGYQPK